MLARPAARRLASRTREGFTLLEVLVVVAILVILASVATFATVSYLKQARIDQATLEAQKIQKAAMAYHVKSGGVWPDSLQALVVSTSPGVPPLLEGGETAIMDPWGNPYQFQVIPDDGTGTERFMVFTQSPDGAQIQWPNR
jgi:general secretion pathway protein G